MCSSTSKKASKPRTRDAIPTILVLGGIKTTPAASPSPDGLQPGNWGVDVVETLSGDTFLRSIGWDAAIAQKPADSVFKVVPPRLTGTAGGGGRGLA